VKKEEEMNSSGTKGHQGKDPASQRDEAKRRKVESHESDPQEAALYKSVKQQQGKRCPFCGGNFSLQDFAVHVDECSRWS
jgi:hypothetical protein